MFVLKLAKDIMDVFLCHSCFVDCMWAGISMKPARVTSRPKDVCSDSFFDHAVEAVRVISWSE